MKTILLDAGHGGHDVGAIGIGGAQEKDMTFAIVRDLRELARSRFHIQVTREKDEYISPSERSTLIKTINPDAMVSVHYNASDNPEAHGFEVIVRDLFDYTLAKALHHQYLRAFPLKDRGIINDIEVLGRRLAVLNSLEIPCCLVEVGFITNAYDFSITKLSLPIAHALYAGLVEWEIINVN